MKFTVVFALATLVATISAHGGVVGVDNTNVRAEHVVENVLNNADASNLGKNINADVLSHIASVGGDVHNDDSDGFEGMQEDGNEEDDQEEDTEEGAEDEDDEGEEGTEDEDEEGEEGEEGEDEDDE